MQLNEIIEENTLASISNRTRLSSENLEKLFKRDFSGFRKVQALGFISILEREYRADLSQLRAECLAYFEGDPSTNEMPTPVVEAHRHPPHKPSSVLDASMGRKTHSMLKPILAVLVGVVLLFAAWWTYTSSKEEDATTGTSGETTGFFTSIMQQAQSWIGGMSDDETAGTDAVPEESVTGETNQSGDTFVIAAASKTTKDSAGKTPADGEKQTADAANDTVTAESQKVAGLDNTAAATTEETLSADGSTTPADTNEAIKQIGDALAAATDETSDAASDTSASLATEVPSVTSDVQGDSEGRSIIKEATERALKDAQEAKAKQEEAARKQAEEEAARQKAEEEARRIAAEEKTRQEKVARERAAQEKAAREKAAKAGVVLIPTKKIWLGIVDLVTMKRSTSVSKKKMSFKNPKGKWIVATGHGWIRFKLGDKEIKFNDGKKHFLLIQKGTVKEIPHEEFQKLNGSKVW